MCLTAEIDSLRIKTECFSRIYYSEYLGLGVKTVLYRTSFNMTYICLAFQPQLLMLQKNCNKLLEKYCSIVS